MVIKKFKKVCPNTQIQNSEIGKIIFQYYPSSIKLIKPLGYLQLHDFVRAIRDPNEATKPIQRQIATITNQLTKELSEADRNRLTAQKRELKGKLYSFTPCVNVEKSRTLKEISEYTGFMVLDHDHVDSAPDMKRYFFDTYKSIVCAWLSPSQRGFKSLVKIPIIKTHYNPLRSSHRGAHISASNEFKSYVLGFKHQLIKDFQTNEIELQKTYGYDGTVKNAVLPLFIGYDTDILIRSDPETWTGQYFAPPPPRKIKPVTTTTGTHQQNIINKIFRSTCKHFGNIEHSQTGHPNVRAASYVLGGHISGSAKVPYDEAWSLLESLINDSSYLQPKKGYLITAKEMLQSGINSPIWF